MSWTLFRFRSRSLVNNNDPQVKLVEGNGNLLPLLVIVVVAVVVILLPLILVR